MERTRVELTPEQQHLLVTLSDETGKAVPTLIAEALDALVAQVRPSTGQQESNGSQAEAQRSQPTVAQKPIWQQFADAFQDVPEEELARLPTDLAEQVDHYVYGLPKRPA